MPPADITTFQSTLCELAFELAQVAVFQIGTDGRCVWSSEALALFEVSATAVPPTWEVFIDRHVQQKDRATAMSALARARAQTDSVHLEVRAVPQGGCFTLRLKQVPESLDVAVVVQDTTRIHEREAELLRAGESRDRLQQLGRWSLLGEIASGLAHEINQPLAAISAFAQAGERMLHLNPPKTERAATLFGEISGQALRAGDVVQRMRSLVKRQASQPKALSCHELLADFRALAEPLARTQHAQLRVIEPAETLQVLMDPAHIQHVLMSLFRNALDALRELAPAERRVEVEARTSGSQIEIAMTDSGPGISDQVARELFRPFFTTKPDGTGLGLSVCRSIIAEHGGTLQFSNANPGARFSILLPPAP